MFLRHRFIQIENIDSFVSKNQNQTHLEFLFNGVSKTGNFNFIELELDQELCDQIKSEKVIIYTPVSFPESQLFMDQHQNKIYLINDEAGIKKYGYAAYFVEEGLYNEVMQSYEKEVEVKATTPNLHL